MDTRYVLRACYDNYPLFTRLLGPSRRVHIRRIQFGCKGRFYLMNGMRRTEGFGMRSAGLLRVFFFYRGFYGVWCDMGLFLWWTVGDMDGFRWGREFAVSGFVGISEFVLPLNEDGLCSTLVFSFSGVHFPVSMRKSFVVVLRRSGEFEVAQFKSMQSITTMR